MFEKFRQLCNDRNVTMYEVSKSTGIKQSTIYMWKKRNSILKISALKKIAEYFDVSIDDLI